MKIKSLSKLPKRKVTISEILGRDEIVKILDEMSECSADIEELIIIYTTKNKDNINCENTVNWGTSTMKMSRIIYCLESMKYSLLAEAE